MNLHYGMTFDVVSVLIAIAGHDRMAMGAAKRATGRDAEADPLVADRLAEMT